MLNEGVRYELSLICGMDGRDGKCIALGFPFNRSVKQLVIGHCILILLHTYSYICNQRTGLSLANKTRWLGFGKGRG